MSYANELRIVDADSHLMEPPDFLTAHAAAHVRDQLPRIVGGLAGIDVKRHEHTIDERAALVALGDDLLRRGPKWHAALGAVDAAERGTALDLLGFEHQVIYSSLCASLFNITDTALRYAGYRAHNEAMAAYCAADPRLQGVALCDLDDAALSRDALEHALALGLGLVWIPARAPGNVSPGHNQHDWFWARLAERRVPFVLHVGSGPLPIAPEWTNNGRAPPTRAPVPEVITSKDLMVVYQPIERFLSVLILDGVLERHPLLRGGAIEMGAGWVPAMLRRLDCAVDIWSKSESELRQMRRKPSEQVSAQLRFTPYPFEDVGQLMRESEPTLYLFSSDYPHAEGGRDPIGRFSRSLAGIDDAARTAFFAGNAREWLALRA